VTDTLVRPTDLKPAPAHIIGPTWRRRVDGRWHLPDRSLGWELLNWFATYLGSPGGEEDEPFIPTDEQARFLLWWYAVDERGRFVYRNGVLRRMKGWGKDPLVAAMSLAELCGPVAFSHFDESGEPVGKRRPSAWVQIAAVSQDQTKNTFLLFPAIATERLKKENKLEILKTNVFADGGRLIEGVTSSPLALEGKRPTFVVMNEVQWWLESNNGHAMYDVVDGNVTKARLGVSRYLAICNAHVPGQQSIGERMWQTYQKVQAKEFVDTGTLYDALEAPADCPLSEIPSQTVDLEGFAKGVQMLAEGLRVARGDSVWLNIDGIVASCLDRNNAVSESRRKFLNQINATEDSWIAPHEWDACVLPGAELLPGDRITLGFDGSTSGDYTALVACRVSDAVVFPIKVWDPEDYDGEIPKEQVDAMVDWAFGRFDVVAFRADVKEFETYVDAWTARFGRQLKVKASPGNPIKFDMRGRSDQFALDCETFLDAVLEQAVMHNGSSTLKQHIENAHRHPTRNGKIAIRKATKDSQRKIDAAVCAVLAYAARQDFLMKDNSRSGKVMVLK
jgi:hypothetical protein